MTGRLEIIIGCMFSGKSSELIRRINRAFSISKKVFVVNSNADTRCEYNEMKTHDNVKFHAVKVHNLEEIYNELNWGFLDACDIVVIDEFQFFQNPRGVIENLLHDNKHVIIAGLSGDFKQQKFGEIVDLIPLADEVTKLSALCSVCGQEANFTKRCVNSNEQVLVGDKDVYAAVCRKHL